MLFIYKCSEGTLSICLGVIFILIFSVVENTDSMPLHNSKQSIEASNKDGSLRQQLFDKTHQSDRLILRITQVIIVGTIFLAFAMLVCLCATYFCATWAVQWSGVSWSRMIPRRLKSSKNQSKKKKYEDLPPAYSLIVACQADERATGTGIRTIDQEPPSYAEALLTSSFGGI